MPALVDLQIPVVETPKPALFLAGKPLCNTAVKAAPKPMCWPTFLSAHTLLLRACPCSRGMCVGGACPTAALGAGHTPTRPRLPQHSRHCSGGAALAARPSGDCSPVHRCRTHPTPPCPCRRAGHPHAQPLPSTRDPPITHFFLCVGVSFAADADAGIPPGPSSCRAFGHGQVG